MHAAGEPNNRNRMHETQPNPLACDGGYRPRQPNADLVNAWPGLADGARFDGPDDRRGDHGLAAERRYALGASRIASRSAA